MSKNPNPQGKGQLATLQTLSESRALASNAAPKPAAQVASELFTSLFVLESEFNFKPIVGKPYFLYLKGEALRLSPLPPDTWGKSEIFGRFVGECELQSDLTWTMALSESLEQDADLMEWLEEKQAAFEAQLAAADRLEDVLPGYNEGRRFYQRAFVFALSHSLGTSMQKSGIAALPYQQAGEEE